MLNRHVPHHKNHETYAGGRIANYSVTDLEVPDTMSSHSSTEAPPTPAALKVSIEYASRIEIWWHPLITASRRSE